jgi:transglutaminase-like putative cysteine protease
MHRFCSIPLLLLLTSVAVAEERQLRLDPALPYQAERLNPVTYDVDFSVVVTPPYHTHKLAVWIPVAQSDGAQEVGESTWSVLPTDVQPQLNAEPTFGNRFAYFEFHDPQGAQLIRHRFRVKTWELRWNLAADKVLAIDRWPDSFLPYRRSESQSVQVDDRFRQLLTQIVPRPGHSLADLGAVLGWVGDHFTYDHHDASLRADSVRMLEKQRGHCSDYHGFCAAMGRALGYPTRVTYGLNPFPKNSPSHCKLEAFLPPYGWISFDVSETQRLVQQIQKDASLSATDKQRLSQAAKDRLLGGFRDNTWFCLTRGTDYELAPPASGKVPLVRTAYIEADGKPLPDPDPADPEKREFSWMTIHDYRPDRPVSYPFKDIKSLESPTNSSP